jgi:hypothetical protein
LRTFARKKGLFNSLLGSSKSKLNPTTSNWAGAQNPWMNLWPVSDKWTVEMKTFCERALKEGNAPQALAELQREWLV